MLRVAKGIDRHPLAGQLFERLDLPFGRNEFVTRLGQIGINDFHRPAAQCRAENGSRRGAEMKFAGQQRRCRHSPAGANEFDVQPLLTKVTLFLRREMIHVSRARCHH
jgi:hypothetical protein